jgi:eukaryotic-like serine/threonine-protein kinase
MDETTPLGGNRRVIGGRYELRGLIGQGGMADVELGYDTQLDRQVAVKILHGRYANDPSFVARFRREAQAAASLNHPNVVGVYDTGESDGRPFIVMEYVDGRSLKELISAERILPERAAEIAGQAALALHYANSADSSTATSSPATS